METALWVEAEKFQVFWRKNEILQFKVHFFSERAPTMSSGRERVLKETLCKLSKLPRLFSKCACSVPVL